MLLLLAIGTDGVHAARPDFGALVAIPEKTTLNPDLKPAPIELLAKTLGEPDLTGVNCSKCHNELATPEMKSRFVTEDVGPFTVTGHKAALASLKRILSKVQTEKPELYAQLHTAGMLCVRWRKKVDTHKCFAPASIHSYGIAIDLYFGKQADFTVDGKCAVGLVELYPYFLAEGWYWGAAFGDNEDPMHFELSESALQALQDAGKL